MTHTVPGFDGAPVDAVSEAETVWQRRKRKDLEAAQRSRRLELDRMADEKRLNDNLKEVWDD